MKENKGSLLKYWVELWKNYDRLNESKEIKKRIKLYNNYIKEITKKQYHNEKHVLFCLKVLKDYWDFLLYKKLKKEEILRENKTKKEKRKSLSDLLHFSKKKKNKVEKGLLEIKLDKKDEEVLVKVGFACFFHDFCYDPLAKDNEEKNAKKAEEYLKGEMDEEWIKDIKRIILSTKHSKKPRNYAEKLMHDLDYAIFGEDYKTFSDYEKNVRKEFIGVIQIKKYLEGRLKFIEGIENIFYLDFFKEKYEEQAKENINRLKKELTKELKEISKEKEK